MSISAEVRWFFSGLPPEEVCNWLRPASCVVAEEPRTDTYLMLPGCRVVGVKLRDRRFEIKGLRDAPRDVDYPNGVRGRTDTWSKLTLDDPIVTRLGRVASTAGSEPIVQVEKRRRLVRYSAARGGDMQAVAPGERPAEGCLVELTELGVEGRHWWTLGLEAFGSPERVVGILAMAAQMVFTDPPPCRLIPADSIAYPAWLDELVRLQEA
jgi:hypothetical protein